jgi:peptidoglycan L-alanyl-D-glutamate endopeptidase CwlK
MSNNMSRFKFSPSSLSKLNEVDERLKTLSIEVLALSPIDFCITEGLRTKERQEQLYKEGKSKTLNSKHLSRRDRGIGDSPLSDAIDICPCINNKPDYSATEDLFFIVGLFYAKAKELGIDIRLGALWDKDSIKENKFVDGYHVELV